MTGREVQPSGLPVRLAAVLHAAGPDPHRDARALAGFLRDGGLQAQLAGSVTLLIHEPGADLDGLVALAPTEEVRRVLVPPHRPDMLTAALAGCAGEGGVDLFVFPHGPSGVEQATRLAARTGGSVATAVREATLEPGGLCCSRQVYSGQLAARLLLRVPPWCLVVDPGWADAVVEPPLGHRVVDDVQPPSQARTPAAITGVEVLEEAAATDLETASFIVVAGHGAGREGVERIAAAAARMGAAFGATRPVVMNGWAPVDRLVGASGARAAPAICLTAGVHGAPALLWGIERSAFIAGIDLDERAPIAGEADAFVHDEAVAVVTALSDMIGP